MEFEAHYEEIEQYLRGQLSDTALEAFKARLSADPEFAQEVALHKALEQDLGFVKKIDLRSKLDSLDAAFPVEDLPVETASIEEEPQRRPWWLLLIVLGVVAVTWVLLAKRGSAGNHFRTRRDGTIKIRHRRPSNRD